MFRIQKPRIGFRRTCHGRSLHVMVASTNRYNNTQSNQGILFSHYCLPTIDMQIRTKVFVSSHNTSMHVSPADIKAVFTNYGILLSEIRQTGKHITVMDCPFCHQTRGELSNQYKLSVKIGDGCYCCLRCGEKGSWYDLKKKLGGYEVQGISNTISGMIETAKPQKSTGTSYGGGNGTNGGTDRGNDHHGNKQQASHQEKVSALPMPSQKQQNGYSDALERLEPDGKQNVALAYLLNVRKIDLKTLKKYGIGRAFYSFPSNDKYIEAECVTFPWMMDAQMLQEQDELIGIKDSKPTSKINMKDKKDNVKDKPKNSPFLLRRIKARSVQNKGWQRLDPPGGGWGFFGYHTIPTNAKEIVITEGEYDAMAVYQATKMPAISLPNGCRNLPVELLPLIERFDKIYLWMDNDGPGQEGAEKFANKLGLKRCFLVQPQGEHGLPAPKDANEALIKGMDLKSMLNDAKVLRHDFVLTFADLRSQVFSEILNPDKYTGVPVSSLPTFTSIIKGFRRGEVTVLTGPTGSGKTTFLGQVSLDMAEAGINTLWGSFEIKNTRLIHKLLRQFGRKPLPATEESLCVLGDQFETLPLYFMKFHGGSEVDDVLNAMDYAVYVHDVEHIILDNMQFMISRKSGNSTFDKFDVQDVAVEKFRKFATEKNVHITLVVHPRKEDEGARLSISSFFGSAKATQEADTILILQNDGRRKYIEVKKNRFDGTLGFAPLFFQQDSGRYVETAEVGKPGVGAGESSHHHGDSQNGEGSHAKSGSSSRIFRTIPHPDMSNPGVTNGDCPNPFPSLD